MKDIYKRYFPVAMFYVFAWIIHIILISIMTFFHFRLDHKLIIVENWIFDFAWNLNLFSKIISFFIFWRYFHDPKRQGEIIEKKDDILINYQVFIYSIMCLIVLVWANKPKLIENVLFSFASSLLHFVTIFFVFILDILIFKVLVKKDDNHSIALDSIFATIVLTSYNVLIFPYIGLKSAALASLVMICFLIFNFFGKSVINAALYICLVICPIFTFFGNDPIWGDKFSTFSINQASTVYYVILAIVMFLYFTFFRRRTA